MSEQTQEPGAGLDDTGVPAGIDLAQFTLDLVGDLNNLRAGKISINQARASAELARQIIRSMHLVVMAQRVIENRAKPLDQQGKNDGRPSSD